jgi:hypothetical protein
MFQQLDQYSVDVRSPGMDTTKSEARAAFKICREIRIEARRRLGLPV